jgi:hypothetical protein
MEIQKSGGLDKNDDVYFLKTAAKASKAPDSQTKAALNRKGNELLNCGDVEAARRIFLTTGYSDGLSRVGDYYKKYNRPLDALQMYWIAPDKRKARPLIMDLALLIKDMI